MAIENIMLETDQVVNFAVCCTADLPISTINSFLTQVHAQEKKEKANPILTLIHDLGTLFWGPTSQLRSTDSNGNDNTDTAILHTPFPDFSYKKIAQCLQKMKKTTGSKIQTDWFLVLDERSAEDGTAVIVNVEEGDGGDEQVREVRVEWKVSSRYLAAASICHPGIDELKEIAEGETDGVLRD